MANPINETGANYISKLNMNSTAYTIKDAWARAEIDEVKAAISGGTHFRGVTTTAIADGDSVKDLTLSPSGSYAAADQVDGDIFIYTKDGKNLEFIVSSGKYSEFGSTGTLGALAYANSASGDVTVPIASAITFNTFTPNVGLGTLETTYTTDTIEVTTSAATASGTFSPAAITIAASSVTLTPTKTTFTALKTVTYDATNATLSISDGTSDEYWTAATGEAAGQTVTPATNQAISVTYDKAAAVASKSFLTAASLTGALAVTGAAPTATITDPTITVTVTPNAV